MGVRVTEKNTHGFFKIQVCFLTPSLKYVYLVELQACKPACSLDFECKEHIQPEVGIQGTWQKTASDRTDGSSDRAREKKWRGQKYKEFIQVCLMLCASFPKPYSEDCKVTSSGLQLIHSIVPRFLLISFKSMMVTQRKKIDRGPLT